MGRNFHNIKAWKRADDLAVMVYSKPKPFPREELIRRIEKSSKSDSKDIVWSHNDSEERSSLG
jgi:hypothetical protein